MILVGIEEKETLNALVVPRRGDFVTWALGVPEFMWGTRCGVVERVSVDTVEGWTFDAVTLGGRHVWGWLGNIIAINGEPVPNIESVRAAVR